MADYPHLDDPQGREPILPILSNPMVDFEGEPAPLPFVCSNNLTTFTIFDTGMGAVRSFVFDVRCRTGWSATRSVRCRAAILRETSTGSLRRRR